MNREYFESVILGPTYEKIKELNKTKGDDYAGDQDALANFKRNAKRLGLFPEQVLMVYLNKHMDAIETFAREGDLKSEPIEGRIDDAILYLMLLKGLVYEKKNTITADRIKTGSLTRKAEHRQLDRDEGDDLPPGSFPIVDMDHSDVTPLLSADPPADDTPCC